MMIDEALFMITRRSRIGRFSRDESHLLFILPGEGRLGRFSSEIEPASYSPTRRRDRKMEPIPPTKRRISRYGTRLLSRLLGEGRLKKISGDRNILLFPLPGVGIERFSRDGTHLLFLLPGEGRIERMRMLLIL